MSGQENFPLFSHLIHIHKTAEYRERASQKLAELTWLGLSWVHITLVEGSAWSIIINPCSGQGREIIDILLVGKCSSGRCHDLRSSR